jgi:hypothetical protein
VEALVAQHISGEEIVASIENGETNNKTTFQKLTVLSS